MLYPNDLEAGPEACLESRRIQTLVQFLPAAGEPREHGVSRCDEFDHQQIARQLSGQIRNLRQRNSFGDQHVMNHREHQDGVEGAAGAVQKGSAVAVAPAGAGSGPGEVYDQRKNVEVLLVGVAPCLAYHHRVVVDGHNLRAGTRGDRAEKPGIAPHVQHAAGTEFVEGPFDELLLGFEMLV